MPPDTVFNWLQGRWSFTRLIPRQATMTGLAWISPLDPDTALYEEQVEVELAAGTALHASRRYRYHATPAGFKITFDDTGELFQALTFESRKDGTLRAEAIHHCAADTYASTYIIDPEQGFEVEHRVTGPRKQYLSHTVYTRGADLGLTAPDWQTQTC